MLLNRTLSQPTFAADFPGSSTETFQLRSQLSMEKALMVPEELHAGL